MFYFLFFTSDIFRSNNLVQNFQQILDNIFLPLFEVTAKPSSHPELHTFLQYVSKINSECYVIINN